MEEIHNRPACCVETNCHEKNVERASTIRLLVTCFVLSDV
jgi:hypothetical protein